MISATITRLPLRLMTLGLLYSSAALAQLPGSLPKTAMPAPSTTIGTSMPGTSTPGTSTPGTSTPGTSMPGTLATGMAMPTAASATTGSTNTAMMNNSPADSAAAQLDDALSASNSGNKAAAVKALNAGVAAAEQQATSSKGDFGTKLMNQAGNLKKLIPGVQSGLVSGNVLAKAVALVKMALGANQISSLLTGGGSLLGSAGALTSGLSLLKGGLPSLGGQSAAMGGTLLDGALNSVSKLGNMGGAVAEPAVKQQLGNVLNFAKGIL